MTNVDQVQADLGFIRAAVNRKQKQTSGHEAIYLVWAVYTLVGYTLIDMAPRWSSPFFLIGLVPAMIVSALIGRAATKRIGQVDLDLEFRRGLHWGAGAGLILAVCVLMQVLYPQTRDRLGGQICVELFGLLYFTAGVHFDRIFLWLGPLLMIGGLAVGKIHFYPWTSLGVMLAVGLSVPYLGRRWRHG